MQVSEEFVEFLSEGAVAIEVYGHKQANHRRNLALWDLGVIQAKTRSLRERYIPVQKLAFPRVGVLLDAPLLIRSIMEQR